MELLHDVQDLALVALAGGLGGVVGLEREISDKPAGLRTHVFVSAGAALLMLLSDAILESARAEGCSLIRADPIRMVQAIVVGVSFLGAGTIIHQGGHRVEGLTTAASIFLTAGIGVAVAVDRLVLAFGTTILAVTVLALVGWVERQLVNRRKGSSEPKEDAASSDETSSGTRL